MNILPSVQPGPQPAGPNRGPAEVLAVRRVENPGGRPPAYHGPQGSDEEQEAAVERLDRQAEADGNLSRQAQRALNAYTAHARDDERRYTRQVLGFDIEV